MCSVLISHSDDSDRHANVSARHPRRRRREVTKVLNESAVIKVIKGLMLEGAVSIFGEII